jgi:hypothetical protein
MRTKLFTTILILALALSGLPGGQAARAADITVTTTADDLDAAGSCGAVTILSLPGPDGVTSLREAMCATNNNAGADTIQFDIPGCGSGCTIQPTIALPVLTDDETTIDGYTQDGASPATGAVSAMLLIEIDGSAIASNNGLNIASSGNEIRGLAINRFPLNGIAIGGSGATDNVIAGNHIGTDLGGSVDLGNGLDGVFVGLGAHDNIVGGDEPAERNVISGNDWNGVAIHGSDTMSNTVKGNFIGVTADGLDGCANELHGVYVYGGAHGTSIGGRTAGERNVISGNGKDGVRIYGSDTAGNAVAGNYIGTDASGLAAIPNGESGISIRNNARNNLIGGDNPERSNIISGNTSHGIHIDDAHHIEIVGNFIGLGATGLTAVANGGAGIMLTGGARDNTIGGTATAYEGNLISGNDTGIWIQDTGTRANRVRGNIIGVAIDSRPLGNTHDGVHLSFGAQNNTIGPSNAVVYNGDDGVGVDTPLALGNTITHNVILGNSGLAIHLTNGAHNGIAAPAITSVPEGPGDVTGTACPGCTVEVFASWLDDGGIIYLGSATADGGGDFALTIPALAYPFRYVSATATDATDGTSEFSEAVEVDVPVTFLPLVVRNY